MAKIPLLCDRNLFLTTVNLRSHNNGKQIYMLRKWCVFLSIGSLLFVPACVFAQQKVQITGKVSDEAGSGLPYAGLYVEGTAAGTSTSQDGSYVLDLSPGTYVIVCRYLGYQTGQKTVTVGIEGARVDFTLQVATLKINEVVVRGGEDPALAVIRHAIKKRRYYENQVKAYRCQVYVKGVVRIQDAPKRILGQKMDYAEAGIDTAQPGILFLSESLSDISVERPRHVKQRVISSRQSGGGLGFDFPVFIDFYQSNIPLISRQFTPRGYISPLADQALHYYDYHLAGTFRENGAVINKIQVTPKRKQEPLFSGYINIVSGSWRIHSLDFLVTQDQQLQLIDSLQITQIHAPLNDSVWKIRNQTIHFKFNQFGIKLRGTFLDVYSAYDLHPHFPKNYFNSRVILAYDSLADKKSKAYWDSARAVPLEKEEARDFRVKDSTTLARQDSLQSKRYIDSLRHHFPPPHIMEILWSGYTIAQHKPKGVGIYWAPTLRRISYNTVEGLVTKADISFFSNAPSGASWSLTPDLRYGWHNQHFNPSLQFNYRTKKQFATLWYAAGGKRTSQINHQDPIYPWTNSLNTLLAEENYMKIYENYFGAASVSHSYINGFSWELSATFEDRYPLTNTTNFTLINYKNKTFTPNHPYELADIPFLHHQALVASVDLTFQPGQHYIQYPWGKTPVGSKAPILKFGYTKGLPSLLGSDVDFDKWYASVQQNVNLLLFGILKYRFETGGFFNTRAVALPDMKHFNGNQTYFNLKYLNSFQLVPYYQYSNDEPLYGSMNVEYHLNGLLTNKVPLFNRLHWNMVCGTNGLYIDDGSKYIEVFAGLENILKVLRVDFVTGFPGKGQPVYGLRIGLGGLVGGPLRSGVQSRNYDSGSD